MTPQNPGPIGKASGDPIAGLGATHEWAKVDRIDIIMDNGKGSAAAGEDDAMKLALMDRHPDRSRVAT